MPEDSELLDSPAYWLELFRSRLVNQVHQYMVETGINQSQLAQHLGVGKSRVSQILHGKENPSIEKVIQILLKIGRVPDFEILNWGEWKKKQNGTQKGNGPDEIGFEDSESLDLVGEEGPIMFQVVRNVGVQFSGSNFQKTEAAVVPLERYSVSRTKIAAQVAEATEVMVVRNEVRVEPHSKVLVGKVASVKTHHKPRPKSKSKPKS